MKIYLVTYDLNKPGQSYEGLYKELKDSYTWWHYLESTWLIYTDENAKQIFNRLRQYIDNNDHLLIIEVGNDYHGWLPRKAWDWIKDKSN